jgi:SAM-dependent methyltransferase
MTAAGDSNGMSACPLCGACRSRRLFDRDGYVFHDCLACRTWFVSNRPSQEALNALYSGQAEERGSSLCWEVEARHDVSAIRRALDLAERRSGVGKMLDIGCGAGPLLALARSHGWTDLTGLEISPTAAAQARKVSGAQVFETTLDAAGFADGTFSLITMWDVIEHLLEPRDTLAHVSRLLTPGGTLAISTPNRFGVSVTWFGRASVVVCPPEHLFLASRKGLRAAFESAGFDLAGTWSEDIRVREWTRTGAESTPADDRETYRKVQGQLTSAGWFETAKTIANVGLRGLRCGDQLLAVAHRRT